MSFLRSRPPIVEREFKCPDCGELIASCRYGSTRVWSPEEIEEDWAALLEHHKQWHARICVAALEALYKL